MAHTQEWQPAAEAGQMGRRGVFVAGLLLVAAVAHILALAPVADWLRALALLVITVALPGVLAVRLLPLPMATWLDHWEAGLYAVGAGIGLLILGMWALSLLPGPLAGWQVLALFDVLIVLLAAAVVAPVTPSGVPVIPSEVRNLSAVSQREIFPRRLAGMTRQATWLVAGVVSVIGVAALLRLPNLGYSDFQGDEAHALLRAADVIQGYPSALLIHKKGPAEILLPAALYAPLDRIGEAQARLPFALANLAGLLAVYLLGWRLFGPLAGWIAAMLLAVDGYFVGFARIVQYQSIVFLMTALVVLALHSQLRARRATPVYLWLAALFLCTGLLAHYEALWAVIPGSYLLIALWREGEHPGRLLRGLALPALVAGSVLALFYVPFVLDARFAQTTDDIFGNRIGARFPYNNLADFFLRTTIYSASYYLLLLIGVTVAAWAGRVHRVSWPGWATGVATLLLIAGLAAEALWPGWAVIGGVEHSWLLYAVAIGLAVALPRATHAERTVWLWFGAPLVLSLFFVAKPNSHVYGFFTGWVLLVGATLEQGWRWLAARLGLRRARLLALPVAGALLLVFANYAYQLFVRSDVEVLRTWAEQRPRGYWTPYALPDRHSLFGFPYKNGWKVVGALYAQGVLDAPFDTNETSRIADWYGRGLYYCPPDGEYYMAVTSLQPGSQAEDQALIDELAQRGYHEVGAVLVQGEPRLRILTTRPQIGPMQFYDEADYASFFDTALAGAHFLKSGPLPSSDLARLDGEDAQTVPVDFRLGESIRLRGYSVDRAALAPGETLHVRLYWQATAPIEQGYKVFVQVIDLATTHKAAQRDSEPGCTKYAADEWRVGELNLDAYSLRVAPDTPAGEYTLLVGMYDGENERLPVYDAAGAPFGDAIPLTTLQVAP